MAQAPGPTTPSGGRTLNVTAVSLASFPPGGERVALAEPRSSFLWCLESGPDCVATLTDGRILPLGGEALIFLRPELGATVTSPEHPFRIGRVHFTPGRQMDTLPPQEQWPVIRRIDESSILHALLRHIGAHLTEPEPLRQRLIEPAFQLLLEAYIQGRTRTTFPPRAPSPADPVLSTAAALIAEQAGDRAVPSLRVQEVARGCAVSRASLYRAFHDALNMSPGDCFRWLRLERAAELLLKTDRLVKDVAADTGFADPYYFSRAFQQSYGVSPAAFRDDADAASRLRGSPFASLDTQSRFSFAYGDSGDELLTADATLVHRHGQTVDIAAYPLAAGRGGDAWQPLDLGAALNRPLRERGGGEVWIGSGYSLEQLPLGPTEFNGVPFQIGRARETDPVGPGTVVLCRPSSPHHSRGCVESVAFGVDACAQAIYLLHGCAFNPQPGIIGRYLFAYDNGETVGVDLHALSRSDRPAQADWPDLAFVQDWWPGDYRLVNERSRPVVLGSGANRQFNRRFLYTLQWINPHPERQVRRVTLEMVDPACVMMLLSATALRA